MQLTTDQRHAWEGVLAAVSSITRAEPGSFEYGGPGSGHWSSGTSSSRSPATVNEDGSVSATFRVGDPARAYCITVEVRPCS